MQNAHTASIELVGSVPHCLRLYTAQSRLLSPRTSNLQQKSTPQPQQQIAKWIYKDGTPQQPKTWVPIHSSNNECTAAATMNTRC